MSDLILSLSHYHRHIAIYVVQIIVTMLDRIIPAVCVFYGISFYITVRCGFDKHSYLTSCLNALNHITCIRLAQTGCTARKLALFIISQDRQHKYLPLLPWQPP